MTYHNSFRWLSWLLVQCLGSGATVHRLYAEGCFGAYSSTAYVLSVVLEPTVQQPMC